MFKTQQPFLSRGPHRLRRSKPTRDQDLRSLYQKQSLGPFNSEKLFLRPYSTVNPSQTSKTTLFNVGPTACQLARNARLNDTPLQEFWLFPLLPTEIRDQIWDVNLQKSRFVSPKASVPGSSVPTLLHVCHESRERAKLLYARLESPATRRYGQSSPFYYNYENDWLYLNHGFCLRAPFYRGWDNLTPSPVGTYAADMTLGIAGFDTAKVRRLAMYIRMGSGEVPLSFALQGTDHTNFWSLLHRLFPNIEDLCFVLSDGDKPKAERENLITLIKFDYRQVWEEIGQRFTTLHNYRMERHDPGNAYHTSTNLKMDYLAALNKGLVQPMNLEFMQF